MPPKRRNYEARFKLTVVDFAEKSNNSAAGRQFGVSEKLVRDWRKLQAKIKQLPKTKCADRGLKCHWPELEEQLVKWIDENRLSGFVVTRNEIMLKARSLAKKNKIVGFTGSISWCSRFMKRNGFVLRMKTKISQKLPADLEDKITNFQSFVIKLRRQHNYDLKHIGNMDETPTWFDMPSSKTVNKAGAKTVYMKTSGHEKVRFTTVLVCMADGTKLKPMVIFKRKTMPKDKFPRGIVVHVHPKGWMDEEGMKVRNDKVWRTRPGGLSKTRSLLVFDSFSGHLTDGVKRWINAENTDLCVIPGGLTSVVQPLDVCLNKPFKDRLRDNWCQWMAREDQDLTSSGNLKRASLPTVCQWVLDAWEGIKHESVVYSFKKCAIANNMDGTEDDMLWEDEQGSSDDDEEEQQQINEEVEAHDPFDDRVTAEQLGEIFGYSDDSDT